MSQIKLDLTTELEEMLSYLKRRYKLVSEAEAIKKILSEWYGKEKKEEKFQIIYARLKKQGKKLGREFLGKKGLKPEDITEEQLYDLLKKV
jgi:hypothetical protein